MLPLAPSARGRWATFFIFCRSNDLSFTPLKEPIVSDRKSRRKKAEAWLLRFVSTIDPSGFNHRYYTGIMSKLTDEQFFAWGERIRDGRTHLWVYAPNGEVFLRLKDVEKAAKMTNTSLHERITQYDEATDRWYTSPHEYPILRVPVRRLKQYQMDKLAVPESDRTLNPLTGQVTRPDKTSSISMSEGQTYDGKGLLKTLVEFTNIRGGNEIGYASMRRDLEETGRAKMSELDNSGRTTSVRTASDYLRAMHIDNNL